MRKPWILFISTILVFAVCGKESGKPRYEKESKEYALFRLLSDSLSIPVLDPDQSIDLIQTKKFTVRTGDILPRLYQAFYQYESKLNHFPKSNLPGYIRRLASMEAERQIMLLEAQKRNISAPEDTVQSQLQKIYDNYGSQETFERLIAREGFTPEMIREDVTNNVIVQKYIDDIHYTQVAVDEEKIRELYEEDKLVTVRHVLLITQDKSEVEKKQIYEKMQSILSRAKAGEDFAGLATQYSEDPGSRENGGLYEDFPRGQMMKPFEDASFNTPVGQISDIVETKYGYHIIQVLRRNQEDRPFEEMKRIITIQLARKEVPDFLPEVLDSLKIEYKYTEVFPEDMIK